MAKANCIKGFEEIQSNDNYIGVVVGGQHRGDAVQYGNDGCSGGS